MTRHSMRSAAALALLLCAPPVLAQEAATAILSASEIVATGRRADAHGPAGTMADHMHKGGDLMIGLSWMHEDHGGANRRGSDEIADADIAAAGFTARTRSMQMDMAMLHIMYAPSDRLTLMLAPSWMRMRMTMLGIAPSVGHGGHSLAVGETMSHTVSGIGDTQVGALLALSHRPALSAHAGLVLSVPTGSVTRKDDHGSFVHYGMQPGSGTWDLQPSITLRGAAPQFGWGLQASYLARTGTANRSGFRFGDKFAATGWLSKPLGHRVSLSARLAYSKEGAIEGHYSSGHNHASPPDRQANYGGERLEAGLGINAIAGDKFRLSAEATLPVWQQLNGIQPHKRFGVSAGISRMF